MQCATAHVHIQLGSSSRAIHGGAYFSAIFGRNFNPTTVLRPSQPLACYWRVIFPALCHFSFVFEKYTVLKAAFQEDFFKNGQNGFLTSVILHFFCNSCHRIDPCDHIRTVKMASSSILITLHRFFSWKFCLQGSHLLKIEDYTAIIHVHDVLIIIISTFPTATMMMTWWWFFKWRRKHNNNCSYILYLELAISSSTTLAFPQPPRPPPSPWPPPPPSPFMHNHSHHHFNLYHHHHTHNLVP